MLHNSAVGLIQTRRSVFWDTLYFISKLSL